MRILGIGADQFNSRDGIIVAGCRSILNIDHFDQYILIDDHSPQTSFFQDEKFDLIVYCGTPWLWDNMQFSYKYKNTMACIAAHPEAKVVWLGLGSSLYLSDVNSNILRNPRDQEMLRNTFKNSLVFVRDSLAHEILTKANVEHHFLMCPSYFFKPVCQSSKEFDVIFYHAPQTGISSGYWTKEKTIEYDKIFAKFFFHEQNTKFAVCDEKEIEIVQRKFFETPILLKDPIDTFNICKKARRVLSSRIHNAVPALVYGAEVGIIPVDTRAKVLTDFFDIEVNSVDDLHKIKSCDIKSMVASDREKYHKLIKEFLNA